MPETGQLVMVVGPSGAGKDTLLTLARTLLAGDREVLFPRREITRPADDLSAEDHIPISEADFLMRESSGGYALSWRAHGLAYGVPISIEADLAAKRTVVVNVSRRILDAARSRYSNVRIVLITADALILAERLRTRGREDEADIMRRLERAEAPSIGDQDVIVLNNEGSPQEGAAQLVAAIKSVQSRKS